MPGAPGEVAEVRRAVAALQASLSKGPDAERHQESLEASAALLRALDADFGPPQRVDAGAQAQRAAALASRGQAAKHSRSAPELPPGKRHLGLEEHRAWKATAVSTQPSFSMRAKLVDPSAKEARPEPGAYTIGGSTTHRGRKRQRDDRESAAEAAATEALDHEAVFNAFGVHGVTREQVCEIIWNSARTSRQDAPSWTIGAGAGRQNGIPKPATQPGPGEYSLPSSLLPNPTMKRDGQVPFLTAKRRPLHEAGTSDVAPHDYQTAKGGQETGRPVVSQAPAYSMRAKLADPADRQKKPDCVTYTVKDGVTHKGPVKGPSWTVSPAGRASGMPKAKDPGPGPGEYSVPTTFEGKHPLFPSCASAARAETKRCDPDDTPVLYPDRHY